MERYKHIIERLLELCSKEDGIKAVIAIGSQCRDYNHADQYSDLDLIIGCDDPDQFLYQDDWLSRLGDIQYTFVERTIANEKERRVLFEGSLDVDFIVLPTESLRYTLKNHVIDEIMERGYKVLYDAEEFQELAKGVTVGHGKRGMQSEQEFKNNVNDFFYHTIWARKKILRGEVWTAKMCVDAYLKNHLLKMIETYEMCTHGKDYDVWHAGRMLEQWAEEWIVEELKQCYAHYDSEELKEALEHTTALYIKLGKVCAKELGYVTGVSEIDQMK